MLFHLFSVIALGASSVLASTPTSTLANFPLNPPSLNTRSAYHPIAQLDARGLTNAKRLAAGLPLMPPRRRHHPGAQHPKPSSTPGNPGCTDGHLEVRDKSGKSLGYVRNTVNSYGQYGLTNSADNRLIVSVDLEAAKSGAGDIKTKNGPDSNLPFFGGIVGYSSDCNCGNLKQNSRNYVYLGATTQTSALAPPSQGSNSFSAKTKLSRNIQSAIFKYDSATSSLTPQWINEDGSAPATHLGYTGDSLILVGDEDSFVKNVGKATWVTFHFSPL